MIVITVVYASERDRAKSSTTSRTVACRRFHSRSITADSSGPRNRSRPRAGRLRRRRSSATPRLSRLPLVRTPRHPTAGQEAGMPFAGGLPPVRERDVQLDHEVSIAGHVDRLRAPVAPLDQAGEDHGRELALRVRLVEPGPDRGTLRGVLADRQRVDELQSARIGQGSEREGGALIGIVVRPLEQRRIALKEVELPVDAHLRPLGSSPTSTILRPCSSERPSEPGRASVRAQRPSGGRCDRRIIQKKKPPISMTGSRLRSTLPITLKV